MAANVIKKDGSKQPFDEGKLRKSIEGAAQDAGLAQERAQEVVDQVFPVAAEAANAKEEIATSELRDVILDELKKAEPSVAEAWGKYSKSNGA